MWITVPAAAASIDVLRSVTAVVAGHTSLEIDRVDDLRLAVSEGAGRLIRAGEQRGTLRASFTTGEDELRVHLTLRDGVTAQWPIGPDADPLSWIVIDTLTDAAEESLDGDDPCIAMRMHLVRP
jgi:serine/threonine-protein kinase RsbW